MSAAPGDGAPAASGSRRRTLLDAVALVAAVVAALAVAVLAGVVWAAIVPRTPLTKVSGGLQLDEVAGATVFAATGWFCVVTGVVGLAVGLLAAPRLRRVRSVSTALAGTAAAVALPALLAVVTRAVGQRVGAGPSAAQVAAVADQGIVDAPLHLGTPVALAVGPLVAALVVFVVTAWPRRAPVVPGSATTGSPGS